MDSQRQFESQTPDVMQAFILPLVDPSEAVMIGDTDMTVRTAKAEDDDLFNSQSF